MKRIVMTGALVACLMLAVQAAGVAQTGMVSALVVGAAQDLGPAPPKPRLRRLRTLADAAFTHAYYWTPSPDGRWFSYVDWNTGNLARYDLATDESRDLTHKGTWSDSEEFAEVSAISPDGARIAFGWRGTGNFELRLIDSDGSNERILWTSAGGEYYYMVPAAWSPNGDELLVYRSSSSGEAGSNGFSRTTAMIFSPDTGASRAAWTFEGPPGITQYSPDGRYLAYSIAYEGPAGPRDLVIRDLEQGRETALVSGPESESFIGWSADGSQVFFHSELGGVPSIWSLPVSNGVRSGPPALVRRDVPGLVPAGAGSNRFFYTVSLERPQVFTMAMEIPSGRVLKAPAPEEEFSGGSTRLADWSPSGEYLAYAHFESPDTKGTFSLVIRSASGNNLRQIPLPDLGGGLNSLKWSPNGERVLVSGGGANGRRTRWIDLRTGESYPVPGLENETVKGGGIVFSSDGRYAYIAGVSFDDRKLVRLNLESGAIETLFERPPTEGPWKGLTGVALSPDRKTLAVAYSDTVGLLPVEGGEPNWVFGKSGSRMEDLRLYWGISWTPDGKYLVATDAGTGPATRAVLIIPVDGGEPRRLEAVSGVRGVRLHPDGKRLAFSAGQYKSELWVMEFPD